VKARERCLFPTVVHHETHCSVKSYSARHIVSRESYGADRRDGWRCDLWRLRICLPNTTHLIILPDARAFPAPSMPRTLPAAVPSAYPMLRLNGGLGRTRAVDHRGGGSIGALADSRMQRLEWPPLSQTATRQTFLSTSAKPGIAGRPSRPARPWPRSFAHHLVRWPSYRLLLLPVHSRR
jgi:hypothetical protein